MSQRFSLYDDLSVRENIRLFGGIYGMRSREIKERCKWLLDRLGMEDYADVVVGRLPLGWKQKLAFCVSILHEPSVVFLDEPTGGVDSATRHRFWQLIYDAADEGMTVFVRGGNFHSIAHQVYALVAFAVVMSLWAVGSYKKNS